LPSGLQIALIIGWQRGKERSYVDDICIRCDRPGLRDFSRDEYIHVAPCQLLRLVIAGVIHLIGKPDLEASAAAPAIDAIFRKERRLAKSGSVVEAFITSSSNKPFDE